MLFEILAKVRKEGLMSIEADVEDPHASPIFGKYPTFAERPSCDGVHYRLPAHDGLNLNTVEIESLMDMEIETHHHEVKEVRARDVEGGRWRAGFGIVVYP